MAGKAASPNRCALKTLILKPSSLGDVVQALPVLRLLKAHDPDNQIYWWLSAELRELLEGDPDLSGIFLFERRRWAQPRYWIEFVRGIRQMRRLRFNWVIDLQGLARSSLVAWLVRPGLSVGVEDWREGAPAFYDRVVARPSPLTHAVDWYLEVARTLGVPVHSNFVWMPPRPAAAHRIRERWNPDVCRWVSFIPGARWTNKRWPIEYYAEVVRQVLDDYSDIHCAILGGANDVAAGAALAEINPRRCLDLTGRTSLSELIEWLRLSRLVVTNDTGPMHIAAALGRPIVSVFGPTEARRTGPYGQLSSVVRIELPCAPCLSPRCRFERPLECLRALRPGAVISAIRQALDSSQRQAV
jgi:lipopolysaccharide heptosyltransferase II